MSKIHRIKVTETFVKTFEVVADTAQEAFDLLDKRNPQYNYQDSLKRDKFYVEESETKEELIAKLQHQQQLCSNFKVAEIEPNSKEYLELERLWYLEDKVRNLIT